MKRIGLRLALLAIAVAIVCAVPSRAQDTAAVPNRDLQAKLEYCKTCHGLSGQGFRGASPIPRLAGQQVEYIENQLHAFADRGRENKFMFGVSHVLSPAMMKALAAHFSELNARPLGGAPKDLIPAGKKIYGEGAPTADVPPCSSCHGADAKGNGAFPRLAGQLHDYVFNKLVNWTKERGQNPAKPDASAIMEPIAHALTEPQMKAVGAYVSDLN
jgi:cytochrome c553